MLYNATESAFVSYFSVSTQTFLIELTNGSNYLFLSSLLERNVKKNK